ncbi:putative feruloyl esterase B-2 [Melanomma pulvis-pyrius CBS 109.77]|uniref:Carboxylic ester hydrolase n=1 Tax=Melanomma pulvis-pyrius CBS 109.77 TaxID=1314802 RepID=A0A6A6X292_9PLEO|nr:putative feruloyl esterase B-2 [Melanomma pulvis-pyrius CBS 109.77]
MRFSHSLPLILLSSPVFGARIEDFKARCEALSKGIEVKGYNGISVNLAQYITKNTTLDPTVEGINTTCTSWIPMPPIPVNLCRLALHVPTSNSSEIVLETWLPEDWSGRFVSTGNGGLGGCIQYPDLAFAASYGFATVGNNNGHNGTSGSAFLHQPEVLEDYAWRALYAGAVVGKDITKQFYGKAHKKSYYFGCSSGGRQGWKAAQFNPELFDGIVAGAPAFELPGLFAHYARFSVNFGTGTDIKVSIEKWTAVQQETLRQCDHLDGATDGIVEDTRRCKPDLSKLLCGSHGAPAVCLSPKELSLVEQVFKPWVVDGQIIYSGIAHSGDEVIHVQNLVGEFIQGPTTWASEWPRYVVHEDVNWDLSQFTPQEALLWKQQNPYNINTWEGDLSKFRDRGAKIIHWHGEADQYIDITQSDRYYEHVSRSMRASPQDLDSFYRYFRVGGLQHCWGGAGANSFGQSGFSMTPGDDPEENLLMRIVAWVEGGEAPETVRGTKFVNDDKAQGVVLTRKHCKYPATNVYRGKGNGTDEAGWHCVHT